MQKAEAGERKKMERRQQHKGPHKQGIQENREV